MDKINSLKREIAFILLLAMYSYNIEYFKSKPYGWWPLNFGIAQDTVAFNSRSTIKPLSEKELEEVGVYLWVISDDSAEAMYITLMLFLALTIYYHNAYWPFS